VPNLDFSIIARGCQANCTEELKNTSYGVFSIKCCKSDLCNLLSNSIQEVPNKTNSNFSNFQMAWGNSAGKVFDSEIYFIKVVILFILFDVTLFV
jgi:hypothetical protein